MLTVITKLAMWRILSVIAFLGWVIVKMVINFSKIISNRYYQDFHEDELIKKTDTVNSKNKLYFTTGETKTYIPKYIVAKTDYDRYVICNYSGKYNKITFFVLEYNFKKKVIGVLEVVETYTSEASRIIPLDKRTKYVNVVIKEVEGKTINSRVIMPLSLKSIRKYSFLNSLKTFLLAFSLRQLFIELFGYLTKVITLLPLDKVPKIKPYLEGLKDLSRLFLGNLYNLIIIGAIFVLSILSYLISTSAFKKKNKKEKNGKEGVVEYEFL